jgi:hypothetical protein
MNTTFTSIAGSIAAKALAHHAIAYIPSLDVYIVDDVKLMYAHIATDGRYGSYAGFIQAWYPEYYEWLKRNGQA